MKINLFLLTALGCFLLNGQANGQAITINSSDMPAPTGAANVRNVMSSSIPGPYVGTSMTWNYETHSGPTTTIDYSVETDTFFTNYGIEVSVPSFKSLNTDFGYLLDSKLDFNTTNVKESALFIPQQPYDISGLTGVSGDSLNFPEQKVKLTIPRTMMTFPCTMGTTWASSGRRVTNFLLTYSAASMSNIPGQHAYYMNRKDTVVGWGTLRVYTTTGASIYYDVLMDKVIQYATDSFYLGGMPAPTALLTTFGVTQGQRSDSMYRYNFYRKGTYTYLMTIGFGADYSMTTVNDATVAVDGIIASGIADFHKPAYASILYPNPSNGSQINISLIGKSFPASTYVVTDVAGRTVQQGAINTQSALAPIQFKQSLGAGTYMINVYSANNEKLVAEQFSVQ